MDNTSKNKTTLSAFLTIALISAFSFLGFSFSEKGEFLAKQSAELQQNLVSQGLVAVEDIFGRRLQRGDKGIDVAFAQEMLAEQGYYKGKIDGRFGSQTEEAIKLFQKSSRLQTTGLLDLQTTNLLVESNSSEEEAENQGQEEPLLERPDTAGFPESHQIAIAESGVYDRGGRTLPDGSRRYCALHIFEPDFHGSMSIPYELRGYIYNENPAFEEGCTWGYDTETGYAGSVEVWNNAFQVIATGDVYADLDSQNENGVIAHVTADIDYIDGFDSYTGASTLFVWEHSVDWDNDQGGGIDAYVDIPSINPNANQGGTVYQECVETTAEILLYLTDPTGSLGQYAPPLCDYTYLTAGCDAAVIEEDNGSPSGSNQTLTSTNDNVYLTKIELLNTDPYYMPCQKAVDVINVVIQTPEETEVVNPYITYDEINYYGEVVFEGLNNSVMYSFDMSGIHNSDPSIVGLDLHQATIKELTLNAEQINVSGSVGELYDINIIPVNYRFVDADGVAKTEGNPMDEIIDYTFMLQ